MANRLSKIVTRTGDDGTTGLADGSRVRKDSPRVDAIGDIDELNSVIGLLLTAELSDRVRETLGSVQHDLFDLGGELSLPGHAIIGESHLQRLEQALEIANAALPPLKDFVLPGGTHAAATAHIARTVCRRAERKLVALAQSERVPPLLVQYLNRLSDLLFVYARVLNRHAGGSDVLWEQGKNRRTR
ncbi:MAG TPA: cob(I)yrinic acid a,c-diamide adenosyltransferase [Burkholderiales bacterium]|nr:cob(I)yrinic acid a,c-diamide adenosyltransferase [Burkholderiales bacterium]